MRRQTFDREALRNRRLERGLSIAQVAVYIDRSAETVKSYESGRCSPPISVLVDLAAVLEVPVARFFVDTDDRDRAAVGSVGAGAA